MSHPEHYQKLEQMYLAAPFNQIFSPTVEVSEGRAMVAMQMRPDFWHANQSAHGAIYFKMMDDAAYFAAASVVTNTFLVTATFNIYFMRPVATGEVRSIGRMVYASRKHIIAEATVYDAAEREIGRGSGSFMRTDIVLSPEMGYGENL